MPYLDRNRQREFQRDWMARRRAEWFADKTCCDCGATTGLQLDHVDSSQKVDHKVWSWSAKRRIEELAKCVARCERCHLKKGREEGDLGRGQRRVPRDIVDTIVKRYKEGGITQQELADTYGLGQKTVSEYIRGERRQYK